jgi:DNA-binding transcriptional ArsR family regulator
MRLDQLETKAQQAARRREQARAKALSFPKRHDIYAILTAREACPKEVAEELGMKLHTVMYHFRCLAGKERGYSVPFIEMVDTDRRLGGIQHLWKAIDMPLVGIEEAKVQGRQEREETSALILRRIQDDVARAAEAGTIDAHSQRSLLRMHVQFDEEGMQDAAVLAENYLEALKEIAGESANRIAGGTKGFPVATETMIFPVPGIYWNGI